MRRSVSQGKVNESDREAIGDRYRNNRRREGIYKVATFGVSKEEVR